MSFPTTIDTFVPLVNRSQVLTQSFTLIASVVPFKITTTYGILSTVSFSSIYSTEVTTTPTAGQFRVLYNTNQIELGPPSNRSYHNSVLQDYWLPNVGR